MSKTLSLLISAVGWSMRWMEDRPAALRRYDLVLVCHLRSAGSRVRERGAALKPASAVATIDHIGSTRIGT